MDCSRAGRVVKWDGRDDDVPAGHAGTVVYQRDDGRTRVKFPNGTFKFKTCDLTSMGYSIGDAVTWDRSDSDIPRGTVGRVLGVTDDGDVRAEFLGRSFRFNAEDLTKSEEDDVYGMRERIEMRERLVTTAYSETRERAVTVSREAAYARARAQASRRAGGYTIGNKVYWNNEVVEGAWARSFEVLEKGWGKDSCDVFYKGKKVDGASARSFELLEDGYAKDSSNVFYKGKKVSGASASSFVVLGGGWAKDFRDDYFEGVEQK